MAKQYKVGVAVRAVNGVVKFLNGIGKGPPDTFILHTIGRNTGLPRATPVTLATVEGKRYLVAPYGEVGWVHNVRARPTAQLEREKQLSDISVTPVAPSESAPVLKTYFDELKIVRPYFDAELGDGVEVFASLADQHPVFLIDS